MAPITDQGKLSWLSEGKELNFRSTKIIGKETAEQKAARTIQAAWIENLSLEAGGAVMVPIRIRNAVIEGPLNLRDTTFKCEVSIVDSELTDWTDFSRCTFERNLILSRSVFRKSITCAGAVSPYSVVLDGGSFCRGKVDFDDARISGVLSAERATWRYGVMFSLERAHLDAGISLRGSTFEGEANFANVHIGELAQFQGVRFGAKVSFNEAKIVGGVVFSEDSTQDLAASIFESEADFMGMRLESDANFNKARFICNDKTVSFDGARIDGDLFLVGAQFVGKAIFRGIHVGGQAALQGAIFEETVNFNRSHIGGSFLFRDEPDAHCQAATFKGGGDFINAHILGNADFRGVKFLANDQGAVFDGATVGGDAQFEDTQFVGEAGFKGIRVTGKAVFDRTQFCGKASFGDAHIDGTISFRSGGEQKTAVQFKGEAGFDNVDFGGAADFRKVVFEGKADFSGARFERNVNFCGARFVQHVDFSDAVSERTIRFNQSVFGSSASFREARFHVVYFSDGIISSEPEKQQQFRGHADLRGFTYERIEVAWRHLLRILDPYDRQPYTQLEAVLRGAGQDRTADDVYYARRRCENRSSYLRLREKRFVSRELPRFLFDTIQWGLFHYGVRPYRLLVFTFLVLGLGTTIFMYPHAVTNKEKDLRARDPQSLNVSQAVGVSLKQFLPVEIPSGSKWEPTENPIPPLADFGIPFSAYATFHRAVGWVLVPLGIAALTGLLRRSAKPSAKPE